MQHPLSQLRVVSARDIMTTNVKSFSPATLVPQAIGELCSRRFSEMPIVDTGGRYCGMFSEKCAIRLLASLLDSTDEQNLMQVKASHVMVPVKRLLTLCPEDDAFVAISTLIQHGYSGAPVVDTNGNFLGVFSEYTCLRFVIEAAYETLPAAKVRNFIDTDSNRLIDENTDISKISQFFIESSYGRLPVARDARVIGQVSRRDVLKHPGILRSLTRGNPNTVSSAMKTVDVDSSLGSNFDEFLCDQTVEKYADASSHTVEPERNLFSLAQTFFSSPYRRFPVLEGELLLGVINRSDVLKAAIGLLDTDSVVSRY